MTALDPSAVPVHAPGVRLETDDDGSRLVDAGGASVWRLNATALALWELCDGETTVSEMVAAVGALFSADEDQVRTDVEQTFAALQADGLVTVTGASPARA